MKAILMLVVMVCVCCHVVWAEDDDRKLLEEIEAVEFKHFGLESGIEIDKATLDKLAKYSNDAFVSQTQAKIINLSIQKANEGYNLTFQLWLALNGVKREDFDKWEISGTLAVLKKVEE